MASSPQPARIQEIPRIAKDHHAINKYLRVIAAATIVAIAACVAYVQLASAPREPLAEKSIPNRAVYPDPSTMGLSGTRAGRDIQITWNPQSSTFSDVKIGMLTIKDGGSQREIALTAAELQARKLIYTPITDRVEASLELFSPDRKSTRESVLFVLEPRQDTPPPVIAQRTATPVQEPVRTPRDSEMRSRTEPASTPQVRAFAPPSAVQRSVPERVVMIEPPAPVAAAPASPVPQPVVQLPSAPAPRQQQVFPQQREQQPTVQARPRKPIRQVRPELPANVLAMLRRTVQVDVRARVDASGKVVQTESLAGASVLNRYLGTAAVAAAKLWRFEPGEDSTIILKFRFDPQ